MSRYNSRTDRTRASMGGQVRRRQRHDLRATARLALHKVNPPGTKVAKKLLKAAGIQWRGEVYNTSVKNALGSPPLKEAA